MDVTKGHRLVDVQYGSPKVRAGWGGRVFASHSEIRTAAVAFNGERVAATFLVAWIDLSGGNQLVD